MLSAETKRRIDAARDILVGKLPLPTEQVELITLALIYKFMDDLDEQSVKLGGKRSFFVKDLEPYRWRTLLSQKNSGAERVKIFGQGLEALGDPKMAKHLPEMFRDVFRESMLKFRDGQTLSLFLQEIDGFTYSHSEELGNAFEYLLQTMGIQGDNGQFRTPRHIIDFIVEVLEPKPGEKILDPACGTGGFLVSAYKHILAKHTSKGSSVPGDELSPAKREKLTQNLSGYDITPMMVKLSKVNLFLHGFSDPQIHEYDTLSNDARWNEKADVIMANPPFMTPKGGVVPHTKFRVAAKKAEVLFTDYIAEHLTTNGRAGIIVPEGIIFQSATAYKALRKFLVEDYLVAVISLPAGVFNPYAGVKTSILILDKGLARQTDSIAFFKVENDGYDLGAQRRPIDKNDLPKLTKEIQEHLEKLRSKKGARENAIIHNVTKGTIAANGEFNLGGERYREALATKTNFETALLGDVCEIAKGSPITRDQVVEGNIPVIAGGQKPSCFHNKANRNGNITTVSASGAYAGYLSYHTGPIFASDCSTITPKNSEQLLPLFVFFALKARQNEVYDLQVGMGQPHVYPKDLGRLKIPLPPLETQKEIVAEIESYQKVIDGARSVVENYKPQIPIDPKWQVKELGEICDVRDGTHDSPKYVLEGFPLITSKNLKNGTIDFSDVDLISRKDLDAINKRSKVDLGDLLMPMIGTIGNPVITTDPREFGIKNVALIKFPKGCQIDNRFLRNILSSSLFQEGFLRKAQGASQKFISLGFIRDLKVPVPELDIQKEICAEIEKEQAMVNTNKELIARFEKKIQGVMDRVWGNGTGN